MTDSSDNTSGISSGWNLASIAITGATAGGIAYLGYKATRKAMPTPAAGAVSGAPISSSASVSAATAAATAVRSRGISSEDALLRGFGIPRGSKKHAWNEPIPSVSQTDVLRHLKSLSDDSADEVMAATTEGAVWGLEPFNEGSAIGRMQVQYEDELTTQMRKFIAGDKPYMDFIRVQSKRKLRPGGIATPITTDISPLIDLSKLSRTEAVAANMLNKRIAASKSTQAIFWGQDVILPGVAVSLRASKRLGAGKVPIQTFQEFLTDARSKFKTAIKSKEFREAYGYTSEEHALQDISRRLANFTSRAIRPSSNMTGALSYKERSVILDLSQSQFIGDQELTAMAQYAGMFEGYTERELTSILHGKKPGIPTDDIYPFRPYNLSHMEWALEPDRYVKDIEGLDEAGIYHGSINHPQGARGFVSTVDPDSGIPFGFLQPASRRIDELTQFGLSIPRHNTLSDQAVATLANLKRHTYISKGLSVHSNLTLSNLSIHRMSSGIAGAESGFMGATGLTAMLNPIHVLNASGNIDPVLAQTLYDKLKTSGYTNLPTFEHFVSKTLPKSIATYQAFSQGIVAVGASASDADRALLAQHMGISKIEKQQIRALDKVGRFILPKNIEADSFEDSGRFDAIRRVLKAVRAEKLHDPRVSKLSTNDLLREIFEGKHNKSIQALDIAVKKGEVIALSEYDLHPGKVFTHTINESGKLAGFSQHTLHPESPISTYGFNVHTITEEALSTGMQVSTGITGHATAMLEYMRDAGRMRTASGIAMNPLFIMAAKTQREAGTFLAHSVEKAIHAQGFINTLLSSNHIAGIKLTSKLKQDRMKSIAAAVNKNIGFGYASVIKSVEDPNEYALKFADIKPGTIQGIKPASLEALQNDIDVILQGDVQSLEKHLNVVEPGSKRAKDLLDQVRSALTGKEAQLLFSAEDDVIQNVTWGATHVSGKATSMAGKVSNMGEAGVYGSLRSSKWHMGAVRAAMQHAAPGPEREAMLRYALNHLIAGSRFNTLASETAGMVWAMSGASTSLYDTMKTIHGKLDITGKILDNKEALSFFNGLKNEGMLHSMFMRLRTPITPGLNITPKTSDALHTALSQGYIFDVSKYKIRANALLEEAEGEAPFIKHLYLGPLNQQPVGTDKANVYFGNLQRSKADIIEQLLEGDAVDTDKLQSAVDTYYKAMIGLQSGKTGSVNTLGFGARVGLGGNMRTTTSLFAIDAMRKEAAKEGLTLGENELPLFVRNGPGFTPIESRMTSFISGQVMHGNVEKAIRTETAGLAETVYVHHKGDYVPVGSRMMMYHQRSPTTKELLSILPEFTVILHDGKKFRKAMRAYDNANEITFEKVLSDKGLKSIWDNPTVMHVDQVTQAILDGDMDGDARQLLSMGYVDIMNKANLEAELAMQNKTRNVQKSMASRVQQLLADNGFYEQAQRAYAIRDLEGAEDIPVAFKKAIIEGYYTTGKGVRDRSATMLSRLVQKIFTGRADVFARERTAPVIDLVSREFDVPKLLGMAYNETPEGAVIGEKALTSAERAAFEEFATIEGADAGQAFAEFAASAQHTFVKAVYAKGHANSLLAMSLMSQSAHGYITRGARINSGLSSSAKQLYRSFLETAAGWTTLSAERKDSRIKAILSQMGNVLNQAFGDEEFAAKYAEEKAEVMLPWTDITGKAGDEYAKVLRKMFNKAQSEGGPAWARVGAAGGASDDLMSGMAKIMMGIEHHMINAGDKVGTGKRQSAETLFNMFKHFRGKKLPITALMQQISEMPGSLTTETLSELSAFKEIMNLLPTDEDRTLVRQQATDMLSAGNKAYEQMKSKKKGTKTMEEVLESAADTAARIDKASHSIPGYVNDITRIASAAAEYATASLKHHFATNTREEHLAHMTARHRAGIELKEALLESWHSGRGKVMASAGGILLGLGIASHVAGNLSSKSISLDKEAPLPRRLPLDDMASADAVYEKAPPLNIRVTDGGIPPARATIDTTYASESDPQESARLMSTHSAIGQGTIVVNDYDSFNRQSNRRYQETQANSRF